MGYIELKDGISSRRIDLPGLTGYIRIDVTGEDSPRVVVPAGVTVDRNPDSDGMQVDDSINDEKRIVQP